MAPHQTQSATASRPQIGRAMARLDLYRRVVHRNDRLKRLIGMQAPDIVIRNERRMIRAAIDALSTFGDGAIAENAVTSAMAVSPNANPAATQHAA